jgi:hypothetical protein
MRNGVGVEDDRREDAEESPEELATRATLEGAGGRA